MKEVISGKEGNPLKKGSSLKKGVLFDMDGTLWDSAENVAASWNLALAACGYRREALTREDMYRVMGRTMDVIADMLFPDCKGQRRTDLLARCCEVENDYLRAHGGKLYPGVKETLETLRERYPLYIVSNCQSGYIEAFLDYYGLWELFCDRQCYGDNGLQKADNIRILCERCGLDDAVYVGDIQGDYDASRAAGVQFIHAAYGFGTIDAPTPFVNNFAELAGLVPKLLG